MVKAKVNQPPRHCKPTVGRLIRVEEEVPYSGYTTDRINGQVVAVSDVNPHYVRVMQEKGGVFAERILKTLSKFRSVLRADADAIRKEWLKRIISSPIGSCTPNSLGSSWNAGSDPEIFVLSGNGHVIPAWNFLPSKQQPASEEDCSHASGNRLLFWDGFQAEFTVCPTTCHAYLVDSIRYGIKSVYDRAKKLDKDATVTYQCVLDIDQETLETSPSECVALGCDPSSNAYTAGPNPELAQLNALSLPIRFAGFHIHYGCGAKTAAQYKRMVKAIDAIAGVISVPVLQGLEDVRRRKYYGLAGEYRTPKHGLEYRVLSSACLVHPAVTHLLMDVARLAAHLAHRGFGFIWQADEVEVRECINTLNLDLARKILKENHKALQSLLSPFGQSYQSKANKLIEKGAKELLPTDMRANWKLDSTWARHSNDDKATLQRAEI